MEDGVRKELETLKMMMKNWRRGFLTWAEPNADNDYILKEFHEEISDQVLPYITRLMGLEYLNQAEAAEFMDFCYQQVEGLKRDIEGM